MKKVTLISVVMLFCLGAFAQNNWVKLNSEATIEPEFQIVETLDDGLVIKLNINAYRLYEVQTPRGNEHILESPECPNSYLKGNPNIPFITTALNIPDQGDFKTEIISSTFETLSNISIAPSKGSILRTIDPATVPYEYGKAYQIDEFLPIEQVDNGDPYILRNLRGTNLTIYPFQYNAIDEELRIYTEMIIKIKFNQNISFNEIYSEKTDIDDMFIGIYDKAFLNYRQSEKYTPVDEGAPGNYLIICADEYEAAMADFITWKHEKGIQTELVLMSTVGSTSANVESYIQNYYDTEGMTFVLLVGDSDDVPTNNEGGNDSDNAYAYLVGDDGYADVLIGRFSANSVADVETQVERMITYERDLTTADSWLENGFGSASSQGEGQGHDGGESDVTHMNNIKTDLENWGYTVSHVNESGGTNAQISTIFNNGIGIANYIGHGDVTLWSNTSYSNTQVNALTNVNKLPFIWSVACLNGNFNGNTCFAETWLRATNDGDPTGAIGMLASTILQAWAEPMTAQDEMVDILVGTYPSNTKISFGGLSFNGMFQMIEEGGQGQETADTWTIFGDPSLIVRTKTPEQMSISHLSTHNVGQTEFMVNCDVDNALVSLTKVDGGETVILGIGYVSGGSANVTLTPFDSPGTMKVTVTAYNKVAYQEDVMVIVPDGPYVVSTGYTINDAAANNNGAVDYNETVLINQTLQNVGVAAANGVNVVASTTNANASITQSSASFGDIAVDASVTENDAFTMLVNDGVADQENVMIDLVITDGDAHEWESSYPIVINAPELSIEFVEVDDSESGNSNGMLDAGETARLVINVLNDGHSTAGAGNVGLTSTNPNVTINTTTNSVVSLAINSPVELEFEIVVDGDTPTGESLCFDFDYTAGAYDAQLNTCLPAGLQIEDWESGTLTTYAWENDASYPWTIDTDEVYEGTYSLRSGDIGNEQESLLIINVDVLESDNIEFYKKVSCEEQYYVWVYDYFAFQIDGSEQGSWNGEVDWSQESYSVSVGEHEFKWIYSKDESTIEGQDCAWIDNIKLPVHQSSVTIINENALVEETSVEVYPNPASDIVNLNVNLTETTSATIKVMNMNGQIVYEYSSEFNLYKGENLIVIDASEFANGLYVIHLTTDTEIYQRNIVISK